MADSISSWVTDKDGRRFQLSVKAPWGALIHPDCGDQHAFADPSTERVDYYVAAHSCDALAWSGEALDPPRIPIVPLAEAISVR